MNQNQTAANHADDAKKVPALIVWQHSEIENEFTPFEPWTREKGYVPRILPDFDDIAARYPRNLTSIDPSSKFAIFGSRIYTRGEDGKPVLHAANNDSSD